MHSVHCNIKSKMPKYSSPNWTYWYASNTCQVCTLHVTRCKINLYKAIVADIFVMVYVKIVQ